MTDHFDEVDPANGTEPFVELSTELEPARTVYTAPEKIASVAEAVLANPSADPKMRGLLAALSSGLGRRLFLQPMLDLLPPMDAPEEWDAWLEVLVGVALELASDGVVVDVDDARAKARFILTALFEEPAG